MILDLNVALRLTTNVQVREEMYIFNLTTVDGSDPNPCCGDGIWRIFSFIEL